LIEYGDKDTLLEEWMCLDTEEQDVVRMVMDIWQIFGKVGGT
jgi:hypothetical protein